MQAGRSERRMDTSVIWHNQDPTLSVSSQDEFQQYLDMDLGDKVQLDCPVFDPSLQGTDVTQPYVSHIIDTSIPHARGTVAQDTAVQEHRSSRDPAAIHPSIYTPLESHGDSMSETLSEIDAQIHYLLLQRQLQEQQRNWCAQNTIIPPTPNSAEMHGGNSQFYPISDRRNQAIYRIQTKESDMIFTPLASPAVTPLEAHFNIPEYTTSGAYFSPLSSPALHAQNEYTSPYDGQHSRHVSSSDGTNAESTSAHGNLHMPTKKASKKALQKPSRNVRGMKQSPIVKPRRGKKCPMISAQTLGDIMKPDAEGAGSRVSFHSTLSTEGSENGSISPEHLSDMAPPPVPTPGSANRSPFVNAQKSNSIALNILGPPATPASLMGISQSPTGHQYQSMDIDELGIDDFLLPEAASGNNTKMPHFSTHPDRRVASGLGVISTKSIVHQISRPPTTCRPSMSASASQSPQIESLNGASCATRRSQVVSRSSKKRSGSSVLVSPALLPRVSPNIKPLLPGGGKVVDETASLLLASKSNYQKILEGTYLPGVSYPTELSTNLTSKRTSHKIAEQGRRNRINSALHEIATLLPRSQSKDSSADKSGSGDTGEGEGEGNTSGKLIAQSSNSKASTVEQAIEYIKHLKSELEVANKKLKEVEQKQKEI